MSGMPPSVAACVKSGHFMEWDPPAAITRVVRWTCNHCGAAVLHEGTIYGSVTYGSATKKTCEEVRADWDALLEALNATGGGRRRT